MRIIIDGEENGISKRYRYEVLDRTDRTTGTLSMARTTGYTCTATVNLILEQKYKRHGISPPEFVGESAGCLDYILDYLKDRNVLYKRTEEG